MRYVSFLLAVSIFISCNSNPKTHVEVRDVTLENLTRDSVMVFSRNGNDTLNIFREVEIVENQNNDTIRLGYAIIAPKYTGKVWFAQTSLDPSNAAYLNRVVGLDLDDPNSFSKLFTIGLKNQNYDQGFKKIVLRLRVK